MNKYVSFMVFLLIACSLLQSPSSHGQETTSISALEEQALANSPVIQAYQHRLCSLAGVRVQEGLRPNPELEYFSEDVSSEGGAGKQGVQISQEFITNSKLGRAQNYVSSQIESQRHAMAVAQWRVRTDVRVAAWEFIALDSRVKNLKAIVEINDNISSTTLKLFQSGETTRLNLLNMTIELEKTRNEYANAEVERQAAWRQLACVVGQPDMPMMELSDPFDKLQPPASWSDCLAQLMQTNPQLAQAQARITEAKRKYELEYARNSSNVTVFGGVDYNAENNNIEGRVGVSVPLRWNDRNQGAIMAAQHEIAVAEKDLKRVELSIRQRLADTWRTYSLAESSIQQYKKLLPQAQESLNLATAGWQHGEISNLEMLNAQRVYAQLCLTYIEYIRQVKVERAKLEGKLLTGSLDDSCL